MNLAEILNRSMYKNVSGSFDSVDMKTETIFF